MVNLVRARERTRRLPRLNRQPNDYVPFGGGLNLLDSPLSVKPGELAGALNYEIDVQGGYRRIGGYEAYDGSPSPSEATYWKMLHGMDGTNGRAIDRAVNDIIDGQISGASGSFLAATEEGGYGQNVCINNEEFNNSDWDIFQTTAPADSLVITDDAIAATADYPKLSLFTDSVDASNQIHRIDAATANDITISEGDVVYASCYVKVADSGSQGFGLELDGGAWGSSGGGDPELRVNVTTGAVAGAVNLVNALYGVEAVGDGVYRCWFVTPPANAGSTTLAPRITVYDPDVGFGAQYQGAGDPRIYCGGIQVVVAAPETVHNLFHGRIFGGQTHWQSLSNLTPTDADAAGFLVGLVPDMTRLNDSVDGSAKTHRIKTKKSGNLTPIKVKAGDRLYVEWTGKWTSGQIDYTHITSIDIDQSIFGSMYASFSIATGSRAVVDQFAGWDQAEIDDISGDFFRVRLLSVVATKDGAFSLEWGHSDWTGSVVVSAYTGTGLYSHVTNFRAVALPSADGNIDLTGDSTVHGYVGTTTAARNVKTGSLILGGVTGVFQDDEDLQYLSVDWSAARSVATEGGEADTALDADYTALAVANASAAAAPTGSGPVRGVWEYNGINYCFRDNAGATAGQMFVESGAGWTLVALNERLYFDNGDDATTPVVGDTLTGAGGASAPIRRVVKTSGTWGIDAAGYFILGTVTSGPFVNNEQLQVSAADVALADGANAVQTLPAGGRYEFRNDNFYGASDHYRMYGVNGVGNGFEFDDDPTTGFFCFIETGMAVDTPTHLATHNKHLFYSYPGGSVQLSGDGDPISWTVITGASEIAVGADVTGFNEEVGNSLFIFTRNRTYVLQGNTRANFDLDDFNINAGAHEWSVERIGLGCYLDDRGFTTLLQTQREGSVNFEENAISTLIQPLITDLVTTTEPKCAHLIKNRNIYRCYFDDGRVVSIAFREHLAAGHMPLEYPFTANCAVSGEDANGAEVVFVGADDGYVYQLETGTSFNGAPLRAFIRTVLYHSKSPGRFKKYQQLRLDAQLFGQLSLQGRVEYDFHNDELNLGDELDFTTDEAGGYWDDFTWDEFTWDKTTSGIPQQKLEGEGVNAALYLHSESTSDPVHVIRGMTLQWVPRRHDRRD